MSRSLSTLRWMRSITWHAPLRLFSTSPIRSRPRAPRCWAPSTSWNWPARLARRSCRPRPPRCTVIRPCIRRTSSTGAMSIPSACAPATTRANAAPNRFSSTTAAVTACASKWCVSSTPTAPGWRSTTAASSPISWCRRCAARTSPSTATDSRRARSNMYRTWWRAWCA